LSGIFCPVGSALLARLTSECGLFATLSGAVPCFPPHVDGSHVHPSAPTTRISSAHHQYLSGGNNLCNLGRTVAYPRLVVAATDLVALSEVPLSIRSIAPADPQFSTIECLRKGPATIFFPPTQHSTSTRMVNLIMRISYHYRRNMLKVSKRSVREKRGQQASFKAGIASGAWY
jgi:hypothetical protein